MPDGFHATITYISERQFQQEAKVLCSDILAATPSSSPTFTETCENIKQLGRGFKGKVSEIEDAAELAKSKLEALFPNISFEANVLNRIPSMIADLYRNNAPLSKCSLTISHVDEIKFADIMHQHLASRSQATQNDVQFWPLVKAVE
jgi:hypothetical protein